MKLEVPHFKNINNYSCLVTSVAMVLRYFGTSINQKEVFEKAKVKHPKDKEREFGCTIPNVMLSIKDKGYKMLSWHYRDLDLINKSGKEMETFFKIWWKKIKEAEKLGILKNREYGDFTLIKKYLKKGFPVIVGLKSKTFYQGNPEWEKRMFNRKWPEETNHVIVVTGYENGKYIYNDSSPFLSKKEAKDAKVPESRLKKAWKDANHVKEGIFVLKPM
ncbi:MAG: C39 family peptidase [Candidatus Pacearchaeota archaeon]